MGLFAKSEHLAFPEKSHSGQKILDNAFKYEKSRFQNTKKKSHSIIDC